MQAPYELWPRLPQSLREVIGDDCRQPDCNVVGDSLYYIQRASGFDRIVQTFPGSLYQRPRTPRSLSGCSTIVTRDCTFDLSSEDMTITSRGTCGPDSNAEEYQRSIQSGL